MVEANLNLRSYFKKKKNFPSQVEDQTIQPKKKFQSPKSKSKLLRIFPSQVENQTSQPRKIQSPNPI